MRFLSTALPGLMLIEAEPHFDDRGSFARIYCRDEFAAAGIDFHPIQASLSTNLSLHTLRGLHYQRAPQAEAKLVRCVSGRVWDVAVDLRPGPTFGASFGVELSAERMNALFLPEGMAHGFLTLTEGAVVQYQMDRAHVPGHAAGYRWNDPSLRIDWPAVPTVISAADQLWPDFPDG
jgi:dTDP-4-dehydrorhamnose 3,5-epimerase